MNIPHYNHCAGGPTHDIDRRLYQRARERVHAGHNLVTLAASFSYVRTSQCGVANQVPDGTAYRWLPSAGYRGDGPGRQRCIASFCCQAGILAPRRATTFRPAMVIGCPILHLVDAGNDPVAESGCGRSVAPGNAGAIAVELERPGALTPTERRATGERGRTCERVHRTTALLARRVSTRWSPRAAHE
ncbi:MAG: hypothetical protein OEU94_15175 [Aquincola sp.]|nr:hypothetical protein [Aquincola sp.]MDH4290560.1 hypothetical protein [Aquincola sp.]MDH5330433.1 hypothetical protein [Aquincola sp.]